MPAAINVSLKTIKCKVIYSKMVQDLMGGVLDYSMSFKILGKHVPSATTSSLT